MPCPKEDEMAKRKPTAENDPASAQPEGRAESAIKETALKLREEAMEIQGLRNAELMGVLKESEEVIRATSLAEIQLEIQKGLLSRMAQDKEEKQLALEKLTKENEELKKESDTLSASRNQLAGENKVLTKKIESFKSESAKLEEKNEKMAEEIRTLEKQATHLKEDIDRLEGIRKEFVERISRFREKREDLVR